MLSASLLLLAACSKDEDDDLLSKEDVYVANDAVIGLISKPISVSETQKVIFSKGNLQYNVSTDMWRFAENQWDYVGSDNKYVGQNGYTGWIDLFGWGTGNEPVKYVQSNSSYSSFTDWGAASKLMETLGQDWRTLSKSEWEYIILNGHWGYAVVNNVKGIVLLPDEWEMPSGCSLTSGYSGSYAKNTFTVDQWETMETHGAIFLPAAGSRFGSTLMGAGTSGTYWSSSSNGIDNAFYFSFSSSNMSSDYKSRYYGGSVRLVREYVSRIPFNVD